MQSYYFFKFAYDAKFCLYYHFRPNVCGIDNNMKIRITTHSHREGQFSKKFQFYREISALFENSNQFFEISS